MSFVVTLVWDRYRNADTCPFKCGYSSQYAYGKPQGTHLEEMTQPSLACRRTISNPVHGHWAQFSMGWAVFKLYPKEWVGTTGGHVPFFGASIGVITLVFVLQLTESLVESNCKVTSWHHCC